MYVGVGPIDEDGRTMRSQCQQDMTGAVMNDGAHSTREARAIEGAPNSLLGNTRRG